MSVMFILFAIVMVIVIWFALSILYKFIGWNVNKAVNFYTKNLKEEKKEEVKE